MDFNYKISDVSGTNPYGHIVDTFGKRVSSDFERAFCDMQRKPLSERWSYVVKELLPVTDPNNHAEAFLVCNAVRHVDHENNHPCGQDFDFPSKPCGDSFLSHLLQSAVYYEDFRHYAFSKLAKTFKKTVLGEFAAMVTVPHPDLVDKKDGFGRGVEGLFYLGK